MVGARWLPTYHTRVGIEDVFKRTAYRTKFANQLDQGAGLLDNYHHDLMTHFKVFWPDLSQHCQSFRESLARN
jgi:acyl carrier protein phosphodiesterase